MDEIKLVGLLSLARSKPYIYLDERSSSALRAWRTQKGIYTQWTEGTHPRSSHSCPVLHPSTTIVGSLKDGDIVALTLEIRKDKKKGLGLKFVELRKH